MRTGFGWRGIAMAVSVPLIWGTGLVFAKAAVDQFPPILLMALRFSLTALVMVWIVRLPRRHLPALALIALVGATIQYSLTFTGLAGLDASTAAFVLQLEVLLIVLLGGLFLKERVTGRKWAGIATAFAGLVVLAGEPRIMENPDAFLLVAGGAALWAVGQVMIRRLRGDIDGLAVTAWIAVFAAPQLFVMSFIFEEEQVNSLATAGWVVWASVVYLGLVMTALGYWMWNTLIRTHPVSAVAPFLLLFPVFSAAGGMVFLGETLTLQTALGSLVVLAGVGLVLVEPPADG